MELGGRKSHLPPTTGVVKLGRLNLQRVADGLIGVIDLRKWQEKPRSGENLIEFYEISPNLVEISSDLHEISLKSGFFCRDLENFVGI